jgi:hypothetical protein
MRLPWPRRAAKSKPLVQAPPPAAALAPGEEVRRSVRATLLQGKAHIDGHLYLTDRRLLFEAKKGEARYLVVPAQEVKAAGVYPAPGPTMGMPSSRRACLFVETTKGEHVWWDFTGADESEWLPDVRRLAESARTNVDEDD